MTELLTAAQMRAIEQAAIESGEVTGLELMERAGAGVVEAIFEEWPELAEGDRRAGILCGPGNNGGDGFVIARLLVGRGWEVEVFFYGDSKKLPPDARLSADLLVGFVDGVSPIVPFEGRDMRIADPPVDIWVDAFFGTGLDRKIPTEVEAAFRSINYERNWQENKLVAVDILSGISSDTGDMLSDFLICPDLTVTFHRAKIGHFTGKGNFYHNEVGKVVVKDIGL